MAPLVYKRSIVKGFMVLIRPVQAEGDVGMRRLQARRDLEDSSAGQTSIGKVSTLPGRSEPLTVGRKQSKAV